MVVDAYGRPATKGNGHALPLPADPQLRTLVGSILLERMQFARQQGLTFGGARDEYEVLGYDRVVTVKQYREEYARGGVAGRIVDALPNATWRGSVELIEDEDPDKHTPFEEAWIDLDKKHQIQAKLNRVDKLAGLSTYAVLLIGAPGNLEEELPRGGPDTLLYLTPFLGGGSLGRGGSAESRAVTMDADATVKEFDIDASSPRFGLPLTYQLRRTDFASPGLAKPVHWTRIIHVAENLLDDEIHGLPTLERVWNLLADLRKVTGGGAEAFWLRANQGLHLDIDKDMQLPDAEKAVAALKEQAEEYKHQLTRWLRTRGVEVETLGSDVANFMNPADAILTQIAGAKGIPKRILTGSEMGELASSQDRDNWKDQVNGRQTGYAGPYILRPLVDRFIEYGYLPTPSKGPDEYDVRWPQIQVLTEQEKVEGAKGWASVNASQKEVNGAMPVFTDEEIREKWADLPPLTEEQKAEIAKAKDEAQKRAEEAAAAAAPEEGDDSGVLADQLVGEEDDEELRAAGGPGSGNFGHAGRPGQIGGSLSMAAPDGGSGGGPSGEVDWANPPMGIASQRFNGPDRAERRKEAVKTAHSQLTKAGFVKGEAERRHTPSQKLGRSTAYSGTFDQIRVPYTHGDGRKATVTARWSKYGEHSVIVQHQQFKTLGGKGSGILGHTTPKKAIEKLAARGGFFKKGKTSRRMRVPAKNKAEAQETAEALMRRIAVHGFEEEESDDDTITLRKGRRVAKISISDDAVEASIEREPDVVEAPPRPAVPDVDPPSDRVEDILKGTVRALPEAEREALEEGYEEAVAEGFEGDIEEFFAVQVALYHHAPEGDPRLKTWFSAETVQDPGKDPETKAYIDRLIEAQKEDAAPEDPPDKKAKPERTRKSHVSRALEGESEVVQILRVAIQEEATEVIDAIVGTAIRERVLGGVGSGNFGHSGRPGQVGGSSVSAARVGAVMAEAKVAHTAFEKASGPDADWAGWYATFAIEKLGVDVPKETMKTWITEAAAIHTGADWPERYGEYVAERIQALKTLGGPGSGNFGHSGRPGEVGGSSSDKSASAAQFGQMKGEWSRLNDQLFQHIDDPNSPEARALIDQQKTLVKRMHKLDADPGGLEGVGLPGEPRDVVIIGAGPGGLAAGVMGGAEGLDTLIIEAKEEGGGQAKHSSRVENLPGFPAGVSGEQLAADMKTQAERMGAETVYGVTVMDVKYDPVTDLKTVTTSDGKTITTRAVVIAGGVEFKRGTFEGADNENVVYGDSRELARMGAGKPVVVAGGSNGCAQAALLAAKRSTHVTVVSRKPIDASMSDYQVSALRNHAKITVMEGSEISSYAEGKIHLTTGETLEAGAVGIFFGGRSQTGFLPKEIKREARKGKIITGTNLETDMPGVFAVGDMREGSIGRIGTSIGDGQLATHSIFQYYDRMKRMGKAFAPAGGGQ